MSLNPYLFFNGNCHEAVSYYAKVFETIEPQFMTYGDAPHDEEHPLPKEAENLILHAHLIISDTSVMFSDVMPGMSFTQSDSFSLVVVSKDEDFIRRTFTALSKDGKVSMDLQSTFFSPCYGMLIDKFGVSWQFSLEVQS